MTEDCRQAFEERILRALPEEIYPDALRRHDGSHSYYYPAVQNQWELWQDAFQAGRASIPAKEALQQAQQALQVASGATELFARAMLVRGEIAHASSLEDSVSTIDKALDALHAARRLP